MPVEKIDRGFVRALPRMPVERQIELLVAAGCRARDVYGDKQGGADFKALVRAARRGQIIGVAAGLRVFGEARRYIVAAIDALDEKGAVVMDVVSGMRTDRKGAQMLDAALAAIQYQRSIGSSEEAAARGRKGAAKTNAGKRANRMPTDKARKLWFDKSISSDMAVERAGPGWSKGTMIREFGPSNRPKGAFEPKRR